MGFLASQLGGPVHGKGDFLEKWLGIVGRKVTSGVRVTHDSAMTYSGVWAATRLLTGTMSTLPRELYEQSGASKNPAFGHSTRRMFKREPNEHQGGVIHLEQQFNSLINWGNAFAEKGYDEFGRVSHLWPIHPSRMIRYDESEDTYYFRNDDGTVSPIPSEDMFHVPSVLAGGGRFGRGVIEYAAESIGMGLATEQFGASFFGNGAGPAVVLTHPKTLGPEAAENLRRNWQKRYSGPNRANGALVLEEGTTLSPLTIPPEQAQFLQTRGFNIAEIARWYNVPPHLLRDLSKSSFNNIESESLHFILISVLPWLVRWEDECNRQLLLPGEKDNHFFKFITHGLLRGDMKTQAQFFREMWGLGVYSTNDIRELLDDNPVDNGDKRFVPLNMTTLEKAGEEPPEPEVIEQPPNEPEDEDEEEIEDDEPDEEQAAGLRAALRVSFTSVLSGLVGYEARQAVRMSANPRDFEEKCTRFYRDKFSQTFAEGVGPLLASCRLFGCDVEIGGFVESHVNRSLSELAALLDCPMDEFAGAVQDTVDGWNARVFEEAEQVFGES